MPDLKTIADQLLLELEQPEVEEIDIYENASKLTGVDSNLLRAIDYGETGMGKAMVSPTGVRGHGQLTKAVAKKWGKNREIPKEAMEGSALEIQELLGKTGNDMEKALAAYNGGLGTVKEAEKLAAQKGTYWKDEIINTTALDSVADDIIKYSKNPGNKEYVKLKKAEEIKTHGKRILDKYKKLGGQIGAPQQAQAEQAAQEFSLEDLGSIANEFLADIEKPVTPEDLLFQKAVEQSQQEITGEEVMMEPMEVKPVKPTTGIPYYKEFKQALKEIDSDVDLMITAVEQDRGASHIPPHTGETEPETEEYKLAVLNENKAAQDIMEKSGIKADTYDSIKKFVDTLDFKGLQYPSQESLEETFPGLETTEYNNLRSYIARLKNAMHQEKARAHEERAEERYPMDQRVADLMEAYESTMKYPNVIQGWKQGDVDAKFKKLLGVMAQVNPKKAAQLVAAHNEMDAMIQAGDADRGAISKFAKGFARMLQPMVETGAEAAAIGLATGGVGGALYSLSQWGAMPMGSMFQDMVNQGVSPETASNTVLGFGLAHGAVEMLQVGKLKKLLTGTGVTKEGIKKGFNAYIAKLAKGRVGDVAQEIAEEGVQGLIESFAVDFARQNEGIDERDFTKILKNGFKSALVSGAESAPHLILLTLLTGGIGAGFKKFRQKLPAEEQVTFDEALEALRAQKGEEINLEELGKTEQYQQLVNILSKHKDTLKDSFVTEEDVDTKEVIDDTEGAVTKGELPVEPAIPGKMDSDQAVEPMTPMVPPELGFLSDEDVDKLVDDFITEAETEVEAEEGIEQIEFDEQKLEEEEDAKGVGEEVEGRGREVKEEKPKGKEVGGDRQVRVRSIEKDRVETEQVEEEPPDLYQKELATDEPIREIDTRLKEIPKALWEVTDVAVGKDTEFKAKEAAVLEKVNGRYKITLNPKLDAQQKIKALAHEIGGHAGAANVFQTDKKLHKDLLTIYEQSRGDLKEQIEAKYPEQAEYGQFLEWVAFNVEEYITNPKKEGAVQKVIRVIKKILRKLGIGKAEENVAFRELISNIKKLKPQTIGEDVLLDKMYARHLDSAEVARLKNRYRALRDKMKGQWSGIAKMRKDSKAAFKLANELGDKLLKGKALRDEFNAFVYASLPKTKQGRDSATQRIFKKLVKMMVRERTKQVVDDARTAFKTINKTLKSKINTEQKQKLREIKKKYPTVKSIKETDFDELLEDINTVEEMAIIGKEKEAQARRDIQAELEAAVDQAKTNIKTHGREDGGEVGLTDSLIGTKLETVYHNVLGVKASTIETIVEEMDHADVDESSASMGRIFVENFIGNEGAYNNKLRIHQEIEDDVKKEFSQEEMKSFKGMSIITPTMKQKFGRWIPGTTKKEIKLPSGQVLKGLNESHLISFYLHGLNEHNREALLNNEITFDNKRFTKLTEADVDYLTSEKRLSKLGLKLAKFINKILNTKMKKYLEQTSETLPGKTINLIEHYFPLHRVEVAKGVELKPFDIKNLTNDEIYSSLENSGAFKSRQKFAKGTVLIDDALKTFFDSVNLTASFTAYARPLRLAQAMANRIEPTAKRYGYKHHINEVKQYLRDIEAAQKVDTTEQFINSLIGKAASATLGANIPVVLRQVGSYFSAGSELDYAQLAKAAAMKMSKEDLANIRKESPLIRARQDAAFINAELGGSAARAEIGRVLGQGKAWTEYPTLLIHKMDTAVINRIVLAAKMQVENEGGYTSETDKWKKIAKLAEKTVRRTQPMWAKEFRSGIGRKKGVHYRLMFAFTSATNALQNTMKRSLLRYKRTGDIKKLLLDLIMAWVGSAAFMVFVDYLRSKWLGYETDQFENYMNFSRRLLAPFYLVEKATSPIVDIILSIKEGRRVTRTTEFATNTILSKYGVAMGKIYENVWTSIKKKDLTAKDYDRIVKATVQTIHLLGMLATGMPVENVWKYTVEAGERHSKKRDTTLENAGKEVGYKPRISETFTSNKIKYRFYDEIYNEYQNLVYIYADNLFSTSIYNRLKTEEERKNYIAKTYRQAKKMAFYNFKADKKNFFKLRK